MALRRTVLNLDRYIVSPNRWDVTGPVCDICQMVVDYEELVEGEPGWGKPFCKVLVKHHGAEELATFDFGSVEWDHKDLAKYMQRRRWFEPKEDGSAEEGTLAVRVGG